jgi:hypothetical protein
VEQLEARHLLSAPQILLTPAVLATLQQKVTANTPQWQAFQSTLDGLLPQVIGPGSFQGSQLELISDFALGYQLLKDDPATAVTAAMYADKAIAIMKSGLNDYQRGGNQALQYLTRGDDTTTAFTLPGAGILSDSMRVVVSPVRMLSITRGAADGADTLQGFSQVIQVSRTLEGSVDYVAGRDWVRNPKLTTNDQIDWSPPGAEPVPGSTYFVTVTSSSGENIVSIPRNAPGQTGGNFYTLSGNTLTFAQPLGTNQAAYVEYVYGIHATDYSTLSYQQTSAGDGGFNSIFIDTTFPSRFLGKHIAMGLDWLYDYPGLSAALKQQATNLLVEWNDYLQTDGYLVNSPASNYEAGAYVSRVMTAVALSGGRDPLNGPRLITDIQNYRDTYVKPLLTNPTTSLKGGFWAEGWNYGALAVQNILLAEQALETVGLAREANGQPPGTEERQWASEVLQSLISDQPTQATIYDGGDGNAFPAAFPDKNLVSLLTFVSADPTLRSYGNYMMQNYAAPLTPNFSDLLYRDPTAAAAFWSTFPLHYNSTGQGLVTTRADWNYNSTWVSFQLGNLLGNLVETVGHQTMSPGTLQIHRGGDILLANALAIAEMEAPNQQSQYANIVVIDSHGALDSDGNLIQTYPFSTGSWYGSPGVFQTAYEAAADYVYTAGDYRAAYSNPGNPGGGGPATKLTRQVVYLRPDLTVVHDRVSTLDSTYAKQLRWHFLNPPTISGTSFVEQVGSSTLFGQTFSDENLSTTLNAYNARDSQGNLINPVGYLERPFFEMVTSNATPALGLTYTTAFQSAPSTTSSMVNTVRVVSADGKMEGVKIGNSLVLFGKNGVLDPAIDTISYTLSDPQPAMAVFVDLQPGQTYQVVVNGRTKNFTANAQGTISTFTNSAPMLDNSGAPYVIAPAGSRLPVEMSNGILVSDLLARGAGGNPVTDADAGAVEGIALTGISKIDGSFGTWEYTLVSNPQAGDWINVETAGAISNTSALLLPADSIARLRFVTTLIPFHGSSVAAGHLPTDTKLDTGLTFRAWDRTTGAAGGRADTTANGGTTAFSTATETVGTYFEVRLWRTFNAIAQLNTYTLELEAQELMRLFPTVYLDRSTSSFSGFTVFLSPIPGVPMAPLYRMYFGIAFDSPSAGIQTDMGYRYLTTDLNEATSLESLGPAAQRPNRDGCYFREQGVNTGTGIIAYLYTTAQPGTTQMSQIYRTDLFNKDTRTGPPGSPATGTVQQEHGDHVYTTQSAFEMTRTPGRSHIEGIQTGWRQEVIRGFVRELSPNVSGATGQARRASIRSEDFTAETIPARMAANGTTRLTFQADTALALSGLLTSDRWSSIVASPTAVDSRDPLRSVTCSRRADVASVSLQDDAKPLRPSLIDTVWSEMDLGSWDGP